MSQYIQEKEMLSLTLTGVFYTHMWIQGRNAFVKICEYRAPKEIRQYYHMNAPRFWVHPDNNCPNPKKVKKS